MFCSVNDRKAYFLSPDVLQTVWFGFEKLTVQRYTRLISIYYPCVLPLQQKKKEIEQKSKKTKANTTYLLLPGLYIYILHIQLLLRSICIYMSSAVLLPPHYLLLLFFWVSANGEKDIRSALWLVLFHCVYWPVANCASLSLWRRRR